MKKTLVLQVDPARPDKKIIGYAAAAIRGGKLVAFPTETVYGIAANRLDTKAMLRLKRAKKRPGNKPFTVHISSMAMIAKMGCHVTKDARKLMARFWPGPLTIILRSKNGEKIGFRMPANRIAIEIIRDSRLPVVAPSANPGGKPAPKSAGEVLSAMDGEIDLLIDGGRSEVGIESTVVDMTAGNPEVLRKGAIGRKQIFRVMTKSQ